jgi:squalene synthase HpnD
MRETGPDMAALEAKVSGSSFYAAMKIMPPHKRAAMFAIYAFCREVDDIADDLQGDRAQRAAALAAWRADVAALYRGDAAGRAAFLTEAVKTFGLKQDDFVAVIDGMAMDVDDDIIAPDHATLELYCDRVACAVGRLSVRVFGMADQPGIDLSHHLGLALQLTNILRDLDEDAGIGRLYLSRDSLAAAGIAATDPHAVIADPRVDKAARVIAASARAHYDAADKIMKAATVGDMRAPRLMRVAYGRVLERMLAVGWAPPRRRVSLSKLEKLWVALRYGLLA